MIDFMKVVRVGETTYGDVFVKIEWKGGKLSISGVEGPKKNGDCRGSSGQLILSFREYDARGRSGLDDIEPGGRWTAEGVRRFFDVWSRWHLNDMRAGSPAQEEFLRNNPVNAVYPESHYEKASALLATAGLNPDGGYKYGSAWLREEVPAEVLEYLAGLPDTDIEPYWV